MKVRDITAVIEAFAPLSLQESYDNSGLSVGNPESEVSGILLCVDVTESVLDEATALGANLIVSHHPLLFHPLRQVVGADASQRIVARCLIAGISLYAAHTNLDNALGGMNFRLGRILGLKNMTFLRPADTSVVSAGSGVVGDLPSPRPTLCLLQEIKDRLHCGVIRYSTLCRPQVSKIALVTGSGASFIEDAVAAHADLYLSADFKYNDFYTPDNRIVVADLGHFASEYCAIELLYDVITKKIANFAVHRSESSVDPVNYLI